MNCLCDTVELEKDLIYRRRTKKFPQGFWLSLVILRTVRYQDRWKWFLPASRSEKGKVKILKEVPTGVVTFARDAVRRPLYRDKKKPPGGP